MSVVGARQRVPALPLPPPKGFDSMPPNTKRSQGNLGAGIDPLVLGAIASEIKAARSHGIQVAVVVGGGNYFRGAAAWPGLERATADYVGMLATVMNALCLQVCGEAGAGARGRCQHAWLQYRCVPNMARRPTSV